MFKTTIAAAAAAIAFAPAAALAGPYVNVETNALDWRRLHWDNYRRSCAYEGALGSSGASYYVQVFRYRIRR